jgi:hypothetical protein
VAVKRGLSREAAELYPFDETHRALYQGAKRAVAALGRCPPYKLSVPIQAKKEYLVFDEPGKPGRKVTKEGTLDDVLNCWLLGAAQGRLPFLSAAQGKS